MDIVLEDIKNNKPKIDAKRLLGYAKDKSEESYAKLTEEISEVYNDDSLTEIEKQIANDILLLLLQQAELDLREALSERLSVQDNVPLELILRLAHDEIAVASHVLLNNKDLSDLDLATLVQDNGPQHWRAIAQREDIGETVSSNLIETGDIETAINLVENLTATLSTENMQDLSLLALKSEQLHKPLLSRPEVSNDIALSLYVFVSQNLRRHILDRYNINRDLLDKTLDGLLEELHAVCFDSWDITPEMINLAKAFKERDEISSGLLIKTLRRGQLPFFAALISTWIDVDVDIMKKIVERDQGKSFAIACRALGIVKSEFATLYLLSGTLHSNTKDVDQNNLLQIIKFFEKITVEDAQKIIYSWKKKPELMDNPIDTV